MASNLTDQVRNIADGHDGRRQRRPDAEDHGRGQGRGRGARRHDQLDDRHRCSAFAAEVTRVAREVGTEGKLGGQAEVEGVSGTWRGLTENVNLMASNLTDQVRNIATGHDGGRERRPVAEDHGRRAGEILELKNTINTMVDQLRSFAAEVTRVAREVGTEGKPGRPGGGRRRVRHVARAHREREPDGGQPDRPGAQHRPGRDGGRQRRPVAEDHGRRARRDPSAEEHAEHDGRPALVVRRRGHASRPRGGHGRQARRPGRGRGRLRHVARPDREREPARVEPDDSGARDREVVHRGDPGRPDALDRRSRRRARSRS